MTKPIHVLGLRAGLSGLLLLTACSCSNIGLLRARPETASRGGVEQTRSMYDDASVDYRGLAQSARAGTPAPGDIERNRDAGGELVLGGSVDLLEPGEGRQDGQPTAPPAKQRLLIHTGRVQLAVSKIEESQTATKALVEGLGGYVEAVDNTQMTLRIPADRWEDGLEQIAALGRVVAKSLRVQDVSEEVVDLELRLKNARALHARLQEIMKRADTVKDALQVEKELARVSTEIERLEGRLKSLRSRIAYSTLTMQFTQTADAPQVVHNLPFYWLRELGVENLLSGRGR